MAEYDSIPDTLKHIARVNELMIAMIGDLTLRRLTHDRSKLAPPELQIFDEFTPKLRDSTYGSDEYNGYLAAMKPALDHHYAHNSHHPEHGEQPPIEWRAVAGYEGLYEVSSYGDVKSLGRTVARSGGQGPLRVNEKVRKAHVTAKGYLRMTLSSDSTDRHFMVHRLVAEAFIPNPEVKPEVNHRNGDKRDNRVTNLEWVTSSENQIHAYDSGLKDPAVKYVVHCPELDLTTMGTQAMERALRERGHERASAAGIWSAMDRQGKHLDLTFEGTLLAEHRRSRMAQMGLLDLTEMLCDWKAATERHADGDLDRSITLNRERFGFGDEIERLLRRTAERLGWL